MQGRTAELGLGLAEEGLVGRGEVDDALVAGDDALVDLLVADAADIRHRALCARMSCISGNVLR